MLIYDHTMNTFKNRSLQKVYGNNEGFFHGQIQHLDIGPGKGLLLAVFGEKYPLQTYFSNNLTGYSVSGRQ